MLRIVNSDDIMTEVPGSRSSLSTTTAAAASRRRGRLARDSFAQRQWNRSIGYKLIYFGVSIGSIVLPGWRAKILKMACAKEKKMKMICLKENENPFEDEQQLSLV